MGDAVNSPKHYNTHPSGIECKDIIRHLSWNMGNAIKYVWRHGQKDDAIQDLRKACWHFRDEFDLVNSTNSVYSFPFSHVAFLSKAVIEAEPNSILASVLRTLLRGLENVNQNAHLLIAEVLILEHIDRMQRENG